MFVANPEYFYSQLAILNIYFFFFADKAGSQFWNPGLFEVSKSTDSADTASTESTTVQDPLEVKISSDLEGKAKLSVTITDGDQQIHHLDLKRKYKFH